MRSDRFIQPAEGIKIITRAEEPRQLITPETIEAGRAGIAAGEDASAVALDLAIEQVLLRETGDG